MTELPRPRAELPVLADMGVVIIGRNEGQRLVRCLQSVVGVGTQVVYVDSGSTDGSADTARAMGADVVELDMRRPFTAALARNAGWRRLVQIAPHATTVHFFDGDCEVVPGWLAEAMDAGEVAVIAGFQGVTRDGRIATLGRGGSDTSAVAIAAAIKAIRCDIYTDVDGVYTTDPRIEAKARKLAKISYEEMLEMASLGAKVLQTRSVELAMAYNVPVRVLSSFVEPGEAPGQGTIVCDEEEIVEKRIVSGVTYSRDEAKISLFGLPDHPGVSSEIFGALADANVNVDMIVQSHSRAADTANMEFTVGKRDAGRAMDIVRQVQSRIGFEDATVDEEVAKVSVIGVGMRSHTGVAKTMFGALAEKGVNIQVISTSEIKISVLIDAAYTELAVRALHAAYGLDQL